MGVADVIGLGVLLSWKDKATAEIKKSERAIDNLGESVDEVTEKTARLQMGFAKLGKVGATLTAFGVAGALMFFGVTKAAGTFQDTLKDTMTMTGLTGEAFTRMERDLGDLSVSMSTKFGMSAANINKSFYQVLSSGAQAGTKQFTALTESALKLAKVVGMEPAVAVESLSDALHSFEMDVKEAEKMADVFFKTSMLGATTVPQMAEAMKEASKVAVEMKIPLEDVASVLTGFAGKGIKGAEAGTAFRMVMTKLAAPAKNASDALESLGVQVYDSTTKKMRPILDIFSDMKRGLAEVTHEEREAALKAIAGEEAFSKLGGLLASDLSVLSGWSKELKTGGVIQTAFAQKSETLNFAFATLKESLRNVAIVLGQQLLPVITPALNKITLFAGKVREFLSTHTALTKTIVLFGAIATAAALIVGPILMVVGIIGALGGLPAMLGVVATGFASLGSAALALGGLLTTAFWPVTAVAATVALLYFAFKNNFLGIKTIVVAAGKVLWSFFQGVGTGIKTALEPLVAVFQETWTILKVAFTPLIEGGKAIGELIGISLKGSQGMKEFGEAAKVLGQVIGYALITPLRFLIIGISWLLQGLALLIPKIADLGYWLGEKLAPYFGVVRTALLHLLEPIAIVITNFEKIKTSVSGVIDWIAANWGTIKDALLSPVDLILAGYDVLKVGLAETFMTIKETALGIFGSLKDSIAGAFDWIWEKISWVIAKIPNVLLPASLKDLKAEALATSKEVPGRKVKEPVARPVSAGNEVKTFVTTKEEAYKTSERSFPLGKEATVPTITPAVSTPPVQAATPTLTAPRESLTLPIPVFAAAAAGPVDQSIHIAAGAIVIQALRIDESTASKIDRELAKLLERRRERR